MEIMENPVTRRLFGSNIAWAFLWCTCLHFLLLFFFIVIVNLSIWKPLQWIEELYCVIPSTQLLVSFVLITFIVAIFSFINYPTYILAQKFDSRFQYYMTYLSVAKSVSLFQYLFSGVLLAWVYSSYAGKEYDSLFVSCINADQSNRCLSEEKMFFLLLGGWSGLVVFLKDNSLHNKVIVFPIIHELTIFKVKKSILPTIKENSKDGVLTVLSFGFIYYFIQNYLKCFLQNYLFLSIEGIGFTSVFKFYRVLLLSVICICIISSYKLSKLIFHIFFTRHVSFPIEKTENGLCLKEALQMTSVPFLQHLGFYDLMALSENDKERRAVLFSLSLPGGHPHNWKAVFSVVRSTIDSFTDELNKLLMDVGSPLKNKEVKPEVTMLPTGLRIPLTTPKATERLDSFSLPKSPVMRDLSIIYSDIQSVVAPVPAATSVSKLSLLNATINAFKDICTKFKNQIQDPAILNYFLVSNTEYKLICIMQNVQLISWSLESLSLLASKSFIEDKYGIVQQDLPNIIVSIIKLKNALEKLPRNSALLKVFLFYDKLARSNLKSTVKRSLYRLTLTFGEYINNLSLPADVEFQMSHFLNFVES